MSKLTNFDLLLYVAAEEYNEEMLNEIMAMPVTESATPREDRRFRRILRVNSRAVYSWTPFKIALVALLTAMSIAFTACMCIPEVRTAIKKVFLTWCDDYVEIGFHPADETDTNTAAATESAAPAASESTDAGTAAAAESESLADTVGAETPAEAPVGPPDRILQKVYAKDLPEGYTWEVDTDLELLYLLYYFYQDEIKFTITQSLISDESIWADYMEQNATTIAVNGYTGIVLQEQESPPVFTVVWQDAQYEYSLTGYFTDEQDAIGMAEKFTLAN